MGHDSSVEESLKQFTEMVNKQTPKPAAEATKPVVPSLVAETAFDIAVNRKVAEKLEDAGIRTRRDLELGRADMGKIAALLDEASVVDPDGGLQLDPFTAEKIMRNEEYRRMAAGGEQPAAPPEPEPAPPIAPAPTQQDPLAEAQERLAAAEAKAAEWQDKYGKRENQLGEERKRTAERLARLEQGVGQSYQPQPAPYQTQPAYPTYDPRILGDIDPNAPMTAAQSAVMFQQMAAALGSRLSQAQQETIEVAKAMRSYDLTPNEEADLIERHPRLAMLDRATQIDLMRGLIQPLRAASQPAAATPPMPVPQRVNMQELARARVRTATTFIEPSSQGSPQEVSAAQGINSEVARKTARIQELLRTPGGAEEAERLINELSARRR